MSGDEFKNKLDTFFTYLSEKLDDKSHNEYIEENYHTLSDLCKN